ncbi:Ankyrin-3 (ANK-3) (Ankyrin-G) [Durusdinium trenchii]|uniref:Ankyrin-3 (ANK-3) (Ankyrin-G) n=1 Tax=Durusdinium trenchii TaxID=1381693 RepID=A0ABP0HYI2_9DINO
MATCRPILSIYAIYAYVLVYAMRLEEGADDLDAASVTGAGIFTGFGHRDAVNHLSSTPALVGERFSAEQMQDQLLDILNKSQLSQEMMRELPKPSFKEPKQTYIHFLNEALRKTSQTSSVAKASSVKGSRRKKKAKATPVKRSKRLAQSCRKQLGGLLANLISACEEVPMKWDHLAIPYGLPEKNCTESAKDLFLHGQDMVRTHLQVLKLEDATTETVALLQGWYFLKQWIIPLATGVKAAILWAGFWTDASDPEGHKSRTSKERLFDFADQIETQTVHPSTQLGTMAEDNGNLADCQGLIANELKSNMWSFFSFSFVFGMMRKNQDMVVALVHKEMDGARPLSESILFQYEVPSLGMVAWREYWSPHVVLIDLLGTCKQTSPALRAQLFSNVPAGYRDTLNLFGLKENWTVQEYSRRSRLSWTCLDCPHSSCHLDEHLARQVKQLLEAGREQDQKDTRLIKAAKEGKASAVEELLNTGAQANCQEHGGADDKGFKHGYKGDTPLHFAAREGYDATALVLLNHGASVDATNEKLKTPLHLAAKRGHAAVAKILLGHHADVDAKDQSGRAPLHLAAESGDVDMAKLLLKHHAKVDVEELEFGWTPLHFAAKGDHLAMAVLLLEANASLRLKDKNGADALSVATVNLAWATQALLFEIQGSRFRIAGKIGEVAVAEILLKRYPNALDLAAMSGQVAVAKLLLKHRADVNSTINGLTALHSAAKENKADMVELLLQHNANVNARDFSGETPLHQAAGCGAGVRSAGASSRVVEVELLLKAKAEVNPRDQSHQTPLSCAKSTEVAKVCFAGVGAVAAVKAVSAGPEPLEFWCQRRKFRLQPGLQAKDEERIALQMLAEVSGLSLAQLRSVLKSTWSGLELHVEVWRTDLARHVLSGVRMVLFPNLQSLDTAEANGQLKLDGAWLSNWCNMQELKGRAGRQAGAVLAAQAAGDASHVWRGDLKGWSSVWPGDSERRAPTNGVDVGGDAPLYLGMDGLRLEEPEVEHALSQLREEGVVLLWATQDEMFRRVQGTWNSRSGNTCHAAHAELRKVLRLPPSHTRPVREVPSGEVCSALGCAAPQEPSAGRRHFLLRGTALAEPGGSDALRRIETPGTRWQVAVPMLAALMPLCYRYFSEQRPDASPGSRLHRSGPNSADRLDADDLDMNGRAAPDGDRRDRHREEVFAHLNSWLERLDVTLEERSGLPFGFGLEKDLLEELSKEAEVLEPSELEEPSARSEERSEDVVTAAASAASAARSPGRSIASDAQRKLNRSGSYETAKAEETTRSKCKKRLQDFQNYAFRIVNSTWFNAAFAVIIITNSLYLGAQVEVNAAHDGLFVHPVFVVIHMIYMGLFSIEIFFRCAAVGPRSYVCGSGWAWHWLDMVAVFSSWVEFVVDFLDQSGTYSSAASNFRILRIFRITRLVKVLRSLSLVRFIGALRILVHSIADTLKLLGWALLLLILIQYTFSILFTDAALDFISVAPPGDATAEDMRIYYGSVYQSTQTLFRSLLGGLDWAAPAEALSPLGIFWVQMFHLYIAFCSLAVLNVMTGVFCHSAIMAAEHDHQKLIENRKRCTRPQGPAKSPTSPNAHGFQTRMDSNEIFYKMDAGGFGKITISQFEKIFEDEDMKAFFEAIEIDAVDAWTLFAPRPNRRVDAVAGGDPSSVQSQESLDVDGDFVVSIDEFVERCMQLHGSARSVDLYALKQQSFKMRQQMDDLEVMHKKMAKHLLFLSHIGKAGLSLYLSECQLLVSDPGAVNQIWHCDNLQPGLTMILPLTDVDEELGPTHLLPGPNDARAVRALLLTTRGTAPPPAACARRWVERTPKTTSDGGTVHRRWCWKGGRVRPNECFCGEGRPTANWNEFYATSPKARDSYKTIHRTGL